MSAEDCKSLHPGSIPGQASTFSLGEAPSETVPASAETERNGAVREGKSRPAPKPGSYTVHGHRRVIRPIRVVGDVAYVPLTRGYEAIIDAADVAEIGRDNWRAVVRKHTVYASRTDRSGCDVFMHRQITGAAAGLDVDHADRNGLNNRRANLSPCTRAENSRLGAIRARADKPRRGVKRRGSSYLARIQAGGRDVHLGAYNTDAEARAAYEGAARLLEAMLPVQDTLTALGREVVRNPRDDEAVTALALAVAPSENDPDDSW